KYKRALVTAWRQGPGHTAVGESSMTPSSASLRNALIAAGILVLACGAATSATAQGYPHSTVKMIVPTTAGGAVDAFARGIGRRMEQAFGITVVVENKAGANGVIGAELVARSPA